MKPTKKADIREVDGELWYYYPKNGTSIKSGNHVRERLSAIRQRYKRNKSSFSPSRKGDLAEFYAVTWLWDQGYEVFKNAGCSGPVDLIAMDSKGNTILIDVKTITIRLSGGLQYSNMTLTTKQKKLEVRLLMFDPKTRKLKFWDEKNENS